LSSDRFAGLQAVTFDFGNTLVPVGSSALQGVVEGMIQTTVSQIADIQAAAFRTAWDEERERQFEEDVPEGREVDLDRRTIRVVARLRGMPVPARSARWDDAIAATRSTPAEVAIAVEAYSRAFVELMPVPADVGPLLARLAGRFRLAILSNWPHAATIDAYVEAAGWRPAFQAIVVSQRVGTIKPDPRIFRVAEEALGASGPAILHVGDDWAADIIGAKRAGWRAAYLRDQQHGSPLPASRPDGSVVADLEIDSLAQLEAALAGTSD